MWKEITGYEGYYSVSDTGRVRSESRVPETGRLVKLASSSRTELCGSAIWGNVPFIWSTMDILTVAQNILRPLYAKPQSLATHTSAFVLCSLNHK